MAHKTKASTMTVGQLRARRARLARGLPDVDATLRGALQQQTRRCGKPGCRCAEGEPHGPYVYLSVRTGERTGLLYLPAAAAATVRRRVGMTGRIEKTLAAISAINLELLTRGELD